MEKGSRSETGPHFQTTITERGVKQKTLPCIKNKRGGGNLDFQGKRDGESTFVKEGTGKGGGGKSKEVHSTKKKNSPYGPETKVKNWGYYKEI